MPPSAHKKTDAPYSASAYWSIYKRLTLTELRSLTSLVQAVLLTLLSARVAGEIACSLERGLICLVRNYERTGDTVTDSSRLSGNASARALSASAEAAQLHRRATGRRRVSGTDSLIRSRILCPRLGRQCLSSATSRTKKPESISNNEIFSRSHRMMRWLCFYALLFFRGN